MDVNGITALNGGSAGSVAASAVSVPADSRQVLASISSSTALSPAEKTALVSAVAVADSGGLSTTQRAEIIDQVQGLGIYLNTTSNESWPRWTLMTSLRAYGLNLSGGAAESSGAENAARQLVAQVAQGRGVTVDQAVAAVAVQASPPVPVKTEAAKPAAKARGEPGHLVEKVV